MPVLQGAKIGRNPALNAGLYHIKKRGEHNGKYNGISFDTWVFLTSGMMHSLRLTDRFYISANDYTATRDIRLSLGNSGLSPMPVSSATSVILAKARVVVQGYAPFTETRDAIHHNEPAGL